MATVKTVSQNKNLPLVEPKYGQTALNSKCIWAKIISAKSLHSWSAAYTFQMDNSKIKFNKKKKNVSLALTWTFIGDQEKKMEKVNNK